MPLAAYINELAAVASHDDRLLGALSTSLSHSITRQAMVASDHPPHAIINMRSNKTCYMYQKVPVTKDMLIITSSTPVPPPPSPNSTNPFQSLCYHALKFSLKDLNSIESNEVIRDKMAPKLLLQILALPISNWGPQTTRVVAEMLDSSARAFETWKNTVLTIKRLLAVNCTIEIIPPIQEGTEDRWVRYPSLLPRLAAVEPQLHFELPTPHQRRERRKRSRHVRSPAPRRRAAYKSHQAMNKENPDGEHFAGWQLDDFELISCPKKPTLFGLHRGACHVIPIPFATEHSSRTINDATSRLFSLNPGIAQRTSVFCSLELLTLSIPDQIDPTAGRQVSSDNSTSGITYEQENDPNLESLNAQPCRRKSRFYIP